MDNTRDFKLIEGSYTPTEAAEILLTVIQDKITFHNIQLLRCHETCGADEGPSKKRISELSAARRMVTDLIRQSREDGQELEISCNVEIKVKERTKVS